MKDPKTGDTDFIAMMKDFVETFKGQNVSSEAFQVIVEKHMKPQMDLNGDHKMNWFFGAWLYTTEIPSYRLEYSLTPADDGKVLLTGKFYQSGVPKGFHMPAGLYIDFDGNIVFAGRIAVDGDSSKDIKITLPRKPKRVLLNAYDDVLTTSVEVRQVN